MSVKYYTLSHPTLRNRQINSPAGDGSQLFIDSTGHVRNVPSGVAEKLSRSGYTLLGSDAGLISFEAKVPVFVDASVAYERARSVFLYGLREALSSGVSLEDLEAVVARNPRADLVNLRALLGEGAGPTPAWAVAPVAAPAQPAPRAEPVRIEPPALAAAPSAPAPVVAAEAPAELAAAEAPAEAASDLPKVEAHWKVKIPVALAMGAQLPDDEKAARLAADAFLAEQPAQAVIDAIEAYRQSRKK